ncbi:FMN-binding glutamate synthase family protein [Candidatus Uhrbacteria bacterium]|nr:FMN-binding glutamate synthase family protein [Candidatus Uhrbacteria bacterium]
MRRVFFGAAAATLVIIGSIANVWRPVLWSLVVIIPLIALGVSDVVQTRHAVLRNFPIIGHFRYLLEFVRPEIQQYFVESNTDGKPFSRLERGLVYARAKGERDTLPFGTQLDVQRTGYEFMAHSLDARTAPEIEPRIRIGGPRCTQPYDASVFNVSGMSFGALSGAAVVALNGGAAIGGFAMSTGEGGISRHHRSHGGHLFWQIGTGYFGCRTPDGGFDEFAFVAKARDPQVVAVYVKLSQGAKPGHGGILPGIKVTAEIAEARGVPVGVDCISPPVHRTFRTPIELLSWLDRLRTCIGGKPIGFKLCVGSWTEFLGIAKAMRETSITPDFIIVDGGEGGTGAAPLEFSNAVGTPLTDGLWFVHNALTGFDVRKDIRLIASGKIVTGFDIVRRIALGADLCASARAFLFSIGCIQALRCNANTCPTGVTTQDPRLTAGLVIADKKQRVANYHAATVRAFLDMIAAAGLTHPSDIEPHHVRRRTSSSETRSYDEIYDYLHPGQLLDGPIPDRWRLAMARARPDRFRPDPKNRALATAHA